MRGGIVNSQKIIAYKALMYTLFKLKVISWDDFVTYCDNTVDINPLISANKLFVDKFTS